MGFDMGGALQGGLAGGASGGWWGAAGGALAGGFGGSGGDGGAGSAKHMMNVLKRNADKNIKMYESERDQLGGYYNPYIESGTYANTQIDNMLGRGGQAAADTAWSNVLTPGARFLEQQQNAALLRNKAALGDVGGNRLSALTNQSNIFNYGQAQDYMRNMQNQQTMGYNATNAYQNNRGAYTGSIADARLAKAGVIAQGLHGMTQDANQQMQNNIGLGGAIGTQLGGLWNQYQQGQTANQFDFDTGKVASGADYMSNLNTGIRAQPGGDFNIRY